MPPISTNYGRTSELELTPLRYLLAIAETGGITAAARRLRVSQPAISVAVKKLEAQLGTALLLRGSAGVTLTSAGTELVRHANEAFLTLRIAEEQIYNTPEGALRLVDPDLPVEIDTAYLAFRADLQRTRAANRLKEALIARGRALHRSVDLLAVRRLDHERSRS